MKVAGNPGGIRAVRGHQVDRVTGSELHQRRLMQGHLATGQNDDWRPRRRLARGKDRQGVDRCADDAKDCGQDAGEDRRHRHRIERTGLRRLRGKADSVIVLPPSGSI